MHHSHSSHLNRMESLISNSAERRCCVQRDPVCWINLPFSSQKSTIRPTWMWPNTCALVMHTQPLQKGTLYFMLNNVMAHKGIQFRITGDFLTAPLLLVIAEWNLFVSTHNIARYHWYHQFCMVKQKWKWQIEWACDKVGYGLATASCSLLIFLRKLICDETDLNRYR